MTHALSMQTPRLLAAAEAVGRRRALGREVAELTEQLERTPTSSEIAADMDMSEAEVDALLRIGARDVSLSDRVGGDASDSRARSSASCSSSAVAAGRGSAAARSDRRSRPRARSASSTRKSGKSSSCASVSIATASRARCRRSATRCDLSRERIRQIESRAKDKLRRSKRAGELRSYLELIADRRSRLPVFDRPSYNSIAIPQQSTCLARSATIPDGSLLRPTASVASRAATAGARG